MCTNIYTYDHTCVYIISMCTYVCPHVCTYMCTYVGECMCVCVWVWFPVYWDFLCIGRVVVYNNSSYIANTTIHEHKKFSFWLHSSLSGSPQPIRKLNLQMLTMKMTVDNGNFEGKDKMHCTIITIVIYCQW